MSLVPSLVVHPRGDPKFRLLHLANRGRTRLPSHPLMSSCGPDLNQRLYPI